MTVYVIGAGMAGLSAAYAAVQKNHQVVVIEASNHAGGRCYSFYDKKLDAVLDNGTHLMVGANTALLNLLNHCKTDTPLEDIGTRVRFYNPDCTHYELDTKRPFSALLRFTQSYKLIIESLLDTPSNIADKALFLKTIFMCFAAKDKQIYWANPSLKDSLVDPIYNYLRDKADFYFGKAVQSVTKNKIIFKDSEIKLFPSDRVISAIPPKTGKFETIINIHYKTDCTLPDNVPLIGLVGMTGHWAFYKNGILSVTISAANKLDKTNIAEVVWNELKPILKTNQTTPLHTILTDKRATIAQTSKTKRLDPLYFDTCILAGDCTQTGLPCTIEGAVRSGFKAASLL